MMANPSFIMSFIWVKGHSSTRTRLSYSQKTVIIVYKVINMVILFFFTKHIAWLQKAFMNLMDYFYDGWIRFFRL